MHPLGSTFSKIFWSLCGTYVARTPTLSALPPPLDPAIPEPQAPQHPRTRARHPTAPAHPMGQGQAPAPGAPSGSGEFPGIPGGKAPSGSTDPLLSFDVTIAPFAHLRRLIDYFSKSTYFLDFSKCTPRDKRAFCHRSPVEPVNATQWGRKNT